MKDGWTWRLICFLFYALGQDASWLWMASKLKSNRCRQLCMLMRPPGLACARFKLKVSCFILTGCSVVADHRKASQYVSCILVMSTSAERDAQKTDGGLPPKV